MRAGRPRFIDDRDRGRLARAAGLGWFAVLCCLGCIQVTAAAEPYLRLRETTLGYHGAAADFENLTEIRIGWFGPSDPEGPLTGDLWWAATQAAADAKGPLPVRLIPRWSVDPWGTGVSQLTRMVYEEQPLALIGSVDSTTTHLAEQVVAKAQLPLVSPIATDPSVTLAGVSWMFSCAPSDVAVAEALAQSILEELGEGAARRWALVAATDHETRMTSREVVRAFSRRGRLPDFRFDVAAVGLDHASQLSALAAAKPDVVLVLAGAVDSGRLVRGVSATLPGAVIYAGPAAGRAAFLPAAGEAAAGVRYPRLADDTPTAPETAAFTARFLRARGRAPDFAALLTYDATRLLIAAIHHAGPNRARIREALRALSPWSGLAGEVRFDGTGQNVRGGLPIVVIESPAAVSMDRGRPARSFEPAPASPDGVASSHAKAGEPPAVQ